MTTIRIPETVEVKWNVEIDIIERGKRKLWHRSHNIVTNTGRQFIAEVITASAFAGPSFTRTNDDVVRYIGFGIGGNRQLSSAAANPPLSSAYPVGYGGTNAQTDSDVTVARLERPVLVSSGPDMWMKEIVTPGTFPVATTTRFIAIFADAEINVGGFPSLPLSEIGLFKSSADPTLPNGGAGVYPGGTGHMIGYDTFDPIHKTGQYSIEVRWDWRI